MRLVICDDHVVFAESLAHVLSTSGKEIVAITHSPGQLIETLRRECVDVCLLDVRFGSETALDRLGDVRAASPRTRIVLLTAYLDRSLLAAGRAGGIAAIAEKSRRVPDIINLLDRVYAGHSVLPSAAPAPPVNGGADRRLPSIGKHLADFLTPRERQVLSALVHGDDTTKLARSLGIASATARCHVQNVLTKLGAHSRVEAATSAVRYGMIDPETGEWLMASDDPVRARRPSISARPPRSARSRSKSAPGMRPALRS
jgi:two-component system, NarL family, nitrate/nitrite response regulator NarL